MLRSALLDDVAHGFSGREDGDARDPEVSERIVRELGGASLVTVRQVHGRRVTSVAGEEADVVVSTTPGVVVGVRVADCVPILMVAEGAVAAVHAGWRGTAAGVTQAAVDALREVARGPIRAAIGPCICGECYEVGPDVTAALGVTGTHVDLAAYNALVLARNGVEVEVLRGCTRHDGRWFSHRAGDAGRQMGAIRC